MLIYPCGKARNPDRSECRWRGCGVSPFLSPLDDPGSVLAVKGPLRRFAPWSANRTARHVEKSSIETPSVSFACGSRCSASQPLQGSIESLILVQNFFVIVVHRLAD